jgi:putative tricarboxylic transport membrane protein
MNIIDQMFFFLMWPNPLFLVCGVLLGFIFGILPGLAGPQAMVLLLPLTFSLGPGPSVIMLMGISVAAIFGGSVTSILIGVPGTPINAATIIDGFPLAKQGKAGTAIGAAGGASMVGGLIGLAILIAIIPVGTKIVLAFSYQEFFMLILLGIITMAGISEGSLWKGFIAGIFGLLLSTVGFDPISGQPRFTWGIMYLWDGILIVPTMIGLFAVAEGVDLLMQAKITAARTSSDTQSGDIWTGFKEVFKRPRTVAQGGMIGVFIGLIPGVGGSIAQFLAYTAAVGVAKTRDMFGKGDIRGVIAPESSNNAVMGGALVPTLLFGIPGSVETAILLSALMMNGITPGFRMVAESPEVVYALVFSLFISNIICIPICFGLSRYFIKISRIPSAFIGAVVLVLSVVGTYASRGIYGDIVVAFVFGLLGYVMKHHDYSRVSLIIGLILGTQAESSFRQGLMVGGVTSFVTRPISLSFLLCIIALVLVPFLKNYLQKKSKRRYEGEG